MTLPIIKPKSNVPVTSIEDLTRARQQAKVIHVLQYLLYTQLPENGSLVTVPLDGVDTPFKLNVKVALEDNTIEVQRVSKESLDERNKQMNQAPAMPASQSGLKQKPKKNDKPEDRPDTSKDESDYGPIVA